MVNYVFLRSVCDSIKTPISDLYRRMFVSKFGSALFRGVTVQCNIVAAQRVDAQTQTRSKRNAENEKVQRCDQTRAVTFEEVESFGAASLC